MHATVGAYVEEAPRRRLVRPADAAAMAALLVLATLLHGWIVIHACTSARDTLRFARTALNLEQPNAKYDILGVPERRTAVDVLRDSYEVPDPPGFPLATLAVSKVVRLAWDAPLTEQMLLSAQVASSIAAVLLVLPTFWLGRLLFQSAFVGFASALLFQTLPVVAQVMSDGLSDSSSMMGITASLLFGVRAVRRCSTFNALLCGLAGGCAYLVRPEGLIVVLAVAAVFSVLALGRHWPRPAAFGRMTALLVGMVVPATPYMILINGVSNKPSVNEAIQKLIPIRMQTANAQANGAALIADWYSGQGSQTVWAATAIVKETFKTCHYAVLVLGMVGLWWHRDRLRRDAGFAVVLTAGALHVGLLFALGMKPMPADLGPGVVAVPPYVSERHTLLLAWIACLFAAAVLPHLSRFRGGAWVLLIGLVTSALPSALKPLHANRVGHVHAGRYLAEVLQPTDALVDPFDWATWHSGRALYTIPSDPPADKLTARWVVWEPTAGTKQNPHSRLPRLDAAKAIVNDGGNPPALMYQWPADVPPSEAKVVIYKQTVLQNR